MPTTSTVLSFSTRERNSHTRLFPAPSLWRRSPTSGRPLACIDPTTEPSRLPRLRRHTSTDPPHPLPSVRGKRAFLRACILICVPHTKGEKLSTHTHSPPYRHYYRNRNTHTHALPLPPVANSTWEISPHIPLVSVTFRTRKHGLKPPCPLPAAPSARRVSATPPAGLPPLPLCILRKCGRLNHTRLVSRRDGHGSTCTLSSRTKLRKGRLTHRKPHLLLAAALHPFGGTHT